MASFGRSSANTDIDAKIKIPEVGLKFDSLFNKRGKGAKQGLTTLFPSDARTNLPEYWRWQNAMRPEDTGRSEGKRGIPETDAKVSHFEEGVRYQLQNRLEVTRNKFAQDNAILQTEIDKLDPEYRRFQELFNEKYKEMKRPLIIYLSARQGWIGIMTSAASGIGLWFILWLSTGISFWLAAIAAVLGAYLISLIGYPCGLMLRQGITRWIRGGTALFLLAIMATVTMICTQIGSQQFNETERLLIGLLISLTPLIVACFSFLMHDANAEYEIIWKRFDFLNNWISELRNQQEENRIFHLNVAKRHVHLARQIIEAYRQMNIEARPATNPPPAFFDTPPDFPTIDDSFLMDQNK